MENLNLQQQWQTVYNNDDKLGYVSVTGWNEWTAQKHYTAGTVPANSPFDPRYWLADEFNDEFSRDLEPTRTGIMKDNAYILNTALSRKWKDSDPRHYTYQPLSPAGADDPAWGSASKYLDFTGENLIRDFPRADDAFNLTDDTPRNDISSVSVARDDRYLYFKIQCAADITEKDPADTGWLNILLNTKNSGAKDNMGYQFVINRNVNGNATEIDKPVKAGASAYKKAGVGDIEVSGDTAYVKVPLKALGLNSRNYDIQFKVTDNVTQNGDVLSFYDSGESAPCGRLNWEFGY